MRVRYHRWPAVTGGADGSARSADWSWRVMVSIRRAYGRLPDELWHPLPARSVVGLTLLVAVAAWSRASAPALVVASLAVLSAAAPRDPVPRRVLVLVAGVALLAGWRADTAWDAAEPRALGPFHGWVRVVGDPQPVASSTRVVLEVDGERFEYWARGRARRTRVAGWEGGDRVLVRLERDRLGGDRADRVAWQHVVGAVTVDWAADVRAGGAADRASNRVRAAIRRGSASLPGDDAALFRGLVIGDDREQPPEMLDRFRASGLSHLTAVSGQNVAFLLAAAGPLLRRCRAGPRWAATVLLIVWFVALTRFEPSILRAGAMAVLSATAFALGRERSPARLLALAVGGLLLIDPLLVGSVGFWLSVGATGGVTVVGPWLTGHLRRTGPLAAPLAVTLGAQVGVALPALLVFGRLPLVSIPANLLAVPVAGAVMLYGLPAGLLAGAVPGIAPVVMLPCRVGVRWVDTVAALGQRLEPGGSATWAGWLVLLGAVGVVAALGSGKNRHPDGGPPPHR
jgi:competence protein ComEC